MSGTSGVSRSGARNGKSAGSGYRRKGMRHCHVLRVFTRGDTGGNHLGVVTDPTGLSRGDMQEISTGLGFSETVFVEGSDEALPVVRIFTPAAEIPFAGHPLVGAAWMLCQHSSPSGGGGAGRRPAAEGVVASASDAITQGRMSCGIGEVSFRVAGDRSEVTSPMVTEVSEAREGRDIADAAGLPRLAGAWWARMPIPYLVLEAASGVDVASCDPDLRALAAGASAEATYLFARDGMLVKARFFAPGLGVGEDPATGSAAAALAAVLAAQGEPSGSLIVSQGDEIGHPSTIEVGWAGDVVALAGSVRRDEVRILDR